MLKGTVTSVTFKGVHFEILVDIDGFIWMIQSTDYQKAGDKIGIQIKPDEIHVMAKSKYSGVFGDYSSFSDEMDFISDSEVDLTEVDIEELEFEEASQEQAEGEADHE